MWCALTFANSSVKVLEIVILHFFSNFFFFNKSSLKSQNKISFILGRPLKFIIYDFVFNFFFFFFFLCVAKIGILTPNVMISSN